MTDVTPRASYLSFDSKSLRRYRATFWALFALASAALMLRPVFHDLADLWMNTDRPYSHGVLVGPVVLWLVVRACLRVTQVNVSGSWLALFAFASACFVWLLALYSDVLVVQQALVPVILVLAVAAIAGRQMAVRLLFPISFVYFAIPVWDYATPLLQSLTVRVTGFALELADIPAYIEANRIEIPEGAFEIANGCAGLHYFIVAMTISSFYGYVYLTGTGTRIAFVLIAAGLAVITNWVRVVSLVLIGHSTEMQHYLIAGEHYYYGWVLYAVALIVTLMLGYFLPIRHTTDPSVNDKKAQSKQCVSSTESASGRAHTAVLVTFVLLLSFLTMTSRPGLNDAQNDFIEVDLPEGENGWAQTKPNASEWLPDFPGAGGHGLSAYTLEGTQVDAFIAVYRSQSQGSELISSENRLYGPGFVTVSTDRVGVTGMVRLDRVEEHVVSSAVGQRRLIWNWYTVEDRLVSAAFLAKLWQAFYSIAGSESGAVIAVSLPCGEDCMDARRQLQNFTRSMGEALSATAIGLEVER